MGTLTSKTTLGVLSLLVVTAIVILLAIPDAPAPQAAPAVPPIRSVTPAYDGSLALIFDDIDRTSDFTNLTEISGTNHPEGEIWKHFVFWPQMEPVRRLESPDDDTSCSLFVLGENEWIEYELPRAIQDRPGPEIVIYLCNWGNLPTISVTDGHSRQLEIVPTTFIGQYPRGEKGFAFDLSGIDIPFVMRGIRITGRDSVGPYGGCGIDPPKASLEPMDLLLREEVLFNHPGP